jgi:hypothetical protein
MAGGFVYQRKPKIRGRERNFFAGKIIMED